MLDFRGHNIFFRIFFSMLISLFLFLFIIHDFAHIMNGKAKTHEQNRAVICAACGKKDLKCFKVTATIESLIQAEVFKGYSTADVYFPCGICSNCRSNLFASKKGGIVPEVLRDKWNSLDYNEFRAPSRSTPCSCAICRRCRYKEANLEKTEQADLPRKPKEEAEEAEAIMLSYPLVCQLYLS